MFLTDTNRKPTSILLIDDDMISREVVATLLTLNGYSVHSATDGAESLEQIASGACAPQVILMDVQLPGLHGVELIRRLRQSSPASIFAISGSQVSEELLAAADGFLLKPFGVEALCRLLEGRRSRTSVPAPEFDEPVLSPEILAQFRQTMPEARVREIYAAVTADLKQRCAALEAAIARGDAAEVRRIGHAIKGGCGMAGARQAARLGALLESESDHLYNSAKLVQDLQTATQNLERMLDGAPPAQTL